MYTMKWWLGLCLLCGWSGALVIIPLITENRKLSHMVLNNETLFIGATNYIYQLSPDLEIEMKINTGPQNDSQKCGVDLENCSFKSDLSPTDNHNKILLVFSERLVVCGSVFQGKCEIRDSHNISDVLVLGNTAVASNEVDVNTISFISQVYNSDTHKMEPMMYVATEFTKFDASKNSIEYYKRRLVPYVSIRLLDQNYFTAQGTIKVQNEYLKPSLILYVTGFTSGNYSYILFNEKKLLDSPYSSKIVHMCRMDDQLKTFQEVPLICKTNNKTYNFLRTAKVFKPGQNLLRSLQEQFPDLTSDDDVMIGLFNQDPDSNNSAICLFVMKEVKKTVLINARKCLNGSKNNAANKKYENGLSCTEVAEVRNVYQKK